MNSASAMDIDAERMCGIHPERWLQEVGQTNGHEKVYDTPSTTDGGEFMNLQSPLLPKHFDFDADDGFCEDSGLDMECSGSGTRASITNMETQYIDQERAIPERHSLQMIAAELQQIASEPTTPQQQQLQQILQLRQQHQQAQQQHQQAQQQHQQAQQQQQQQEKLQQIVQMLEQPLPQQQLHHERVMQQLYCQNRQQPRYQVQQQQQRQQVLPVALVAAHNPAIVQNGTGAVQSRLPGAVMSTTNSHPIHMQAPSPDSTTPQQPSKRGPRGRKKGREVLVTSAPPSCSFSATQNMAYVPDHYEMRVRVNYRTISAIDKNISNAKGCLIFYNRPVSGDLSGVEPVVLPPLTQTNDGTVTEKQLKFTNQILSVIEKGVRLQADEKGNIYATRHCRSKVFWWNTMSQNDISEEMARDATVKVFNNEEFEEKLRQFTVQPSIKCLKPGVVLTFAQRWSKFDNHLNAHLVYAIITPLRAVQLLEYLMESKGERLKSLDTSLNSAHLMFSNPSMPSNA